MKFIIAIVAASSFSGAALAFAPSASSRISTALNAKVGIYYSTQTGNTEIVADYIAKAAGLEVADIGDVSDDMILELGTSSSPRIVCIDFVSSCACFACSCIPLLRIFYFITLTMSAFHII